ncbi:SatD family protein [Pedobacter sp. BS3]|uniref:SatD family protein n=1 Tax=Pedobacter sp. BS3 TaxID=2567937 RepID=UPI001659866D|nr:SatD family protein [Pedobacter sp. BS3]
MADIIKSRDLNQERLINSFKQSVDRINTSCKKNIQSPLTITLGDEFQGVMTDLSGAVNTILALEEDMVVTAVPFKLRYVLMEGKIETPINSKIAYGMLGPGLTQARETLNNLKETPQRFNFVLTNQELSGILNEAFIVYQQVVDDWNIEKDGELIKNFLLLKDYKLVAEKLHKNRSLMWKREKSLKVEEYEAMKKIINYIAKTSYG